MAQSLKCLSCGSDIEQDVPFRQCPKCLLDLGRLPALPESSDRAVSTLSDTAQPALPNYEIHELIGRGGMGLVYRARQLSLDRTVAVKMIIGGDFAPLTTLARFRREAEAAAKLDHPNIVPIYEIGEYEGKPFLVMKLIEGASLGEKMSQFTCCQREIARLMATVARAVHYAHSSGVLHRDLKPGNILLDSEIRPHLTDFGIAKVADEEPGLTQTAELLGTPGYMSPEQAAGKTLSAATDTYSLGVILYELLTGQRPFEACRPVEVLRKVLEEQPAHPLILNASVERDLATICLKCLEKEPTRRYHSALEFAEDLERWQRREPILARPAGPLLRLRRWAIRNPALTTLIVGLIGGMAITLGLLAKTRQQEARKSIALAILRTETARQLQEIWASPSSFFAIKSETLSAIAGKEPGRLQPGEKRFTMGFVAEGNPLDCILGAAPMLEHLEGRMAAFIHLPTRIDLRLYKTQAQAVTGLSAGDVDVMQLNARDYWRATANTPGIRLLASLAPLPSAPGWENQSAVIFTRSETGIRKLSDLRGRSFLFSVADSTLTFWAKVCLVEAGIRAHDLSTYRYLDAADELSASKPRIAVEGRELGNPFSDMTPVEAVLDRIYDAAVATEHRFAQVAVQQKLVRLASFRDTRPLIVCRSKLPLEAITNFQRALTNLSDPQVLQSFPGYPSRFEACAHEPLAEMRNKLTVESLFDQDAALPK